MENPPDARSGGVFHIVDKYALVVFVCVKVYNVGYKGGQVGDCG